MSVSRTFQDFVVELLATLGPSPRRMFGGVGLFHTGVMFGLLAQDTFYLRVDDGTRPRFESAGMAPFTYTRAGQSVILSAYYEVPADLMEQPDVLVNWARDAVAAARVAQKPGRRS
jgi:DNA transformation protein